MAVPNSSEQSDSRPGEAPLPHGPPQPQGQAQGQTLPQGQSHLQGQPLPQGQPVPVGRPVPLAHPVPAGQPLPQGQAVPQGQPLPQGQAAYQPQPTHSAAQSTLARPVLVKGGADPTAIRARDEESDQEQELASIALKSSPPWLISAAFHMVLLIVLGLLVVAMQPRQQIQLNVESVYAEQLGEQLEFDSPLGRAFTSLVEEPILTPENLIRVEDPFAAPPELEIQIDGTTATSNIQLAPIGLALKGRQKGTKEVLLGRYGGTELTQEAVRLGLEWLARNQAKDGRWSLNGPYSNGAFDENQAAATAMALLAFQGDGNTHLGGQYKRNVIKGWEWLLAQQDPDGNFSDRRISNHTFYTQGLCTIALCELYGMTKDPNYKYPAERAVGYCLKCQGSDGGWRYKPVTGMSDVSVTGWVVMALQSARMAGIKVPQDNLRRVEQFLDKVTTDYGSRYPYLQGERAKLSMTAEGLLCRQYLGWPRDNERLVAGVDWITEESNLIDFWHKRDVYYWYYATQVCHHMEGEHWKKWNEVMRQVMPERQVKTGPEKGSWDPHAPTSDAWHSHGGRLYVTCLSIYMLEVYYRHLPIYSKVYTVLPGL